MRKTNTNPKPSKPEPKVISLPVYSDHLPDVGQTFSVIRPSADLPSGIAPGAKVTFGRKDWDERAPAEGEVVTVASGPWGPVMETFASDHFSYVGRTHLAPGQAAAELKQELKRENPDKVRDTSDFTAIYVRRTA